MGGDVRGNVSWELEGELEGHQAEERVLPRPVDKCTGGPREMEEERLEERSEEGREEGEVGGGSKRDGGQQGSVEDRKGPPVRQPLPYPIDPLDSR